MTPNATISKNLQIIAALGLCLFGILAFNPLALLFSAFFKHYLIARQLNDDAHDWEDDLKRGQVNAVAAALLLQVPQNQHTNQEVLRTIFWQKTMVYVSKDIYSHIKKARQSIAKVSIISKTDFFEHMLRAEENSAKRAIDERKETIAFIKTYKAY
jgi:hypothetical protein